MKNRTLFILTLAVITFGWMACSDSQKVKTDWDVYELKGKVKTLTIKRYKAREAFGELQKEKLESNEVFSFTKDGKIEHSHSLYYFVDETTEYELFYTYSDKKLTMDQYRNDNFTGKQVCIYTEWGDKASETSYDKSGNQTWAAEYTYDDKHRLIVCDNYDGKELWNRQKNFKYTEQGWLKSFKEYNSSGELTEITYFEYDEKGREIECTVEDGEGKVSCSIVRTYNDEGYPSSYKFNGSYFKTAEDYTYEYDKKGNYVVKYEVEQGGKAYIYERTIVYY